MNINDYKLMAYDKLNKDIKEVCQINNLEGTCLLYEKSNDSRITLGRLFEDVVFLGSTGKNDINGNELYEGHIIESALSADKMLVKYGEYDAYCPADRQMMKNVGFYVTAKDLHDMPLGPTEEYAKVIGHININCDLFEEGDF